MQPQKGQNQQGQNKQIPSQDASRAEARKEREGSSFQAGQSSSNRVNVGEPNTGYESSKAPSR